jgi:hypothetical protein
MVGTIKLATIRKQIETALAADGADPIKRLDRNIASAKRKGHRTDVLEGLKRFLETPKKQRRRKQGVAVRRAAARTLTTS